MDGKNTKIKTPRISPCKDKIECCSCKRTLEAKNFRLYYYNNERKRISTCNDCKRNGIVNGIKESKKNKNDIFITSWIKDSK